MSQHETRAFTARSDLVSLASLCGLWIVMIALVNPIDDFPLLDDWRYALGVKSILQTGRFELPCPEAPNVFAQAYWGSLFSLPFGFPFTALRFSTLMLGGAGISAFYLLLREIRGNSWIALLGGVTLAVNPLYFGLAQTFMTDVPFRRGRRPIGLALHLGGTPVKAAGLTSANANNAHNSPAAATANCRRKP